MTQRALFFGGIEEAAEEIGRHYPGGPKVLAHRLRPNKSADAAHRWFLDCCNANRTEHNFTGEDWLALIKIGREIHCHAVIYWLCDEADYERPNPREPEDELTQLLRERQDSKRRDALRDERIERLLERLVDQRANDSVREGRR